VSDIENFFCETYQNDLAQALRQEHPKFDKRLFLSLILPDIKSIPLKERMHKTTRILHDLIDLPYERALDYLYPVTPKLKARFIAMLFPDYVEIYGRVHFNASMDALEYFTKFGSPEFAVRPFLIQDFEKAMPWFLKWVEDKDEHIRRLASEGSRPRLPWAMKIPSL
jgi:hypothetical protein